MKKLRNICGYWIVEKHLKNNVLKIIMYISYYMDLSKNSVDSCDNELMWKEYNCMVEEERKRKEMETEAFEKLWYKTFPENEIISKKSTKKNVLDKKK